MRFAAVWPPLRRLLRSCGNRHGVAVLQDSVMAGYSRSKNGVASLAYSRSKNGVASLAYVPAIHVLPKLWLITRGCPRHLPKTRFALWRGHDGLSKWLVQCLVEESLELREMFRHQAGG